MVVSCIFLDTWIGIDKKVCVKLKVLKHNWINIGIGATFKNSALIEDIFDEEIENANANGEYDDDHARMNTSIMKKIIRMKKKKKRQNTKKMLMKKLTTDNLNNVMSGVHQKMFINIIEMNIC
jgi:hypothetical protein